MPRTWLPLRIKHQKHLPGELLIGGSKVDGELSKHPKGPESRRQDRLAQPRMGRWATPRSAVRWGPRRWPWEGLVT